MNEDFAFLNAYGQVANLSPETLFTNEPDAHYGISLADFYEKLHVHNGVNEKMVSELLTTKDNIIFLVGPRGSGKTTTGLKTISELRKMHFFTHWIAIPEHEANQYLDNRADMVSFLRRQISDYLKERLLEANDDNDDPLCRLTAFLLCQDLPESQRSPRFNTDFLAYQLTLRQLMQVSKIEEKKAVTFLQNKKFEPVVARLQNDLLQQTEIYHLTAAVRHFFKTLDIVIWLDNIDAFEQEAQNALINSIFSIWKTDPNNLRFVVAAREENVLRFDHFYEVQGSVRKSAVYINETKKVESNSGMIMPSLNADKFREIVHKRFDFAREFQKSIEKKVSEVLPVTDEANKRRILASGEKYLPKIPELRKKYLDVLSTKVLKSFESEKMLHLYNNNIRLLLPLHQEFLRYLLETGYDRNGTPLAFFSDESFIKTQLLFWLSTEKGEAANEFKRFNVVEYTRGAVRNSSKVPEEEEMLGCFLPFVLLSCVWNLCLHNRKISEGTYQLPTVGAVVERMARLDTFDEQTIKSAILSLYNPEAGYTMFLAIDSRERLTKVEEIDNDRRIRITYKGRAALASLCNSFGFLFAMHLVSDGLLGRHLDLNQRKLGKYFTDLLPDLQSIGTLHLNSLLTIREKPFYKGKPNWLDQYLDDFGIPLETDFSRTQRACRGDKNSPKRVLYFDSLVNSIESYAKENKTHALRKTIKDLVDQYARMLVKIERREINHPHEIEFNLRMPPAR